MMILLGLLECSLNQFNEFEPVALLQQIKEGMLDVYEEIACDDVWEQSMSRGRLEIGMGTSFTESGALDGDVRSNEDASAESTSAVNFQRKVKPWEALLEAMAISLSGQEGSGSIRGQLQENRKRLTTTSI